MNAIRKLSRDVARNRMKKAGIQKVNRKMSKWWKWFLQKGKING